MKIVTGYTGEPHITSNDDQARNQGIFGTGNYVLGTGNKLNAVLTNATTVTLEDGDGMLQGVHFRIDPGTTEAVSISPGTTGYNRIDLICARYTKDAGTGVEDVSLVVIEGTPSSSTPSAPTYTAGDVLAGDALAVFPLWKVTLTGLTPSLSRVAVISETVEQLSNKIIVYNGTISNIPAFSIKTDEIVTLPSNNYIILGLVYNWQNGSIWSTPDVTLEDDGDYRMVLTAYIYNNKLSVTAYNSASGARSIQYRFAIMELPS